MGGGLCTSFSVHCVYIYFLFVCFVLFCSFFNELHFITMRLSLRFSQLVYVFFQTSAHTMKTENGDAEELESIVDQNNTCCFMTIKNSVSFYQTEISKGCGRLSKIQKLFLHRWLKEDEDDKSARIMNGK